MHRASHDEVDYVVNVHVAGSENEVTLGMHWNSAFRSLLAALAFGVDANPSSPLLVSKVIADTLKLATITSGDNFTCGLSADGSAWCWGANQYGQLGVEEAGDECKVDLMADGPCSLHPVRVSGGLTFRSIEAGSEHVCGITRDGTAYCWGKNIVGELGTTAPTGSCKIPYYAKQLPDYKAEPCSHTPVPVATSLRFTSITAGNFFTCALTNGGRVYCWGANKDGRVGAGTRFDRHPEVTAVDSSVRFSRVSVDGSLACGLSTDGDAYCWGGELAVNPIRIRASAKFTSLSRGWGHTCALTQDGTAYCWGMNDSGQLGVGNATSGPGDGEPQLVSGGLKFLIVEAGFGSTCGVTTERDLYCWGDGETLGANAPDKCFHVDENNPCSTKPVGVALRKVTAVSGGFMHRCALTEEGALYCWGTNDAGAFGNGNRKGSEFPIRVMLSGLQ